MLKLEMIFDGHNVSRDEFSKQILTIIYFFIGQNCNGFFIFLLEIIRNIYDHADKKGKIVLIKNNKKIKFIVFDFGTESYDLKKIKLCVPTGKNRVNFGAGLYGSMIEDMAKSLGIKLKIDTSRGFRYEGVYCFKQ